MKNNWKEELQRNMIGHKMIDIQMSAMEWLVEQILAEQKKELLQELFEESLTAESPVYAVRTGKVIKDFAKSKGIQLYHHD